MAGLRRSALFPEETGLAGVSKMGVDSRAAGQARSGLSEGLS